MCKCGDFTEEAINLSLYSVPPYSVKSAQHEANWNAESQMIEEANI